MNWKIVPARNQDIIRDRLEGHPPRAFSFIRRHGRNSLYGKMRLLERFIADCFKNQRPWYEELVRICGGTPPEELARAIGNAGVVTIEERDGSKYAIIRFVPFEACFPIGLSHGFWVFDGIVHNPPLSVKCNIGIETQEVLGFKLDTLTISVQDKSRTREETTVKFHTRQVGNTGLKIDKE